MKHFILQAFPEVKDENEDTHELSKAPVLQDNVKQLTNDGDGEALGALVQNETFDNIIKSPVDQIQDFSEEKRLIHNTEDVEMGMEKINKSVQELDSPNSKRKPSKDKLRKTITKDKPKITSIGGQRADLNSDKPQYLKLTIEQIQKLAMQ